MEDEPFHPRKNDHLVEPMFAGLGVGEGDEAGENAANAEATAERAEEPRGWFARLVRVLRRVFG